MKEARTKTAAIEHPRSLNLHIIEKEALSAPKSATSQFKLPGTTRRVQLLARSAQSAIRVLPSQSAVEPEQQPTAPQRETTAVLASHYLTPAQSPQLSLVPQPSPKSHTQATHQRQEQPQQVVLQLVTICLISIAITINFSNYGPLIPLLRTTLQVDDGQIGLFSTFLFAGIVLANLPGGILADRFGARAVLLGSLGLVTVSAFLFPLFPNFLWMTICRGLLGLGGGAALVSCSQACANLGKYEPLAQGLNGGAAQLGIGLSLFLMPQLLGLLGWRGALFTCGFFGVLAFLISLKFPNKPHSVSTAATDSQPDRPGIALRTPLIWILGLTNMGTFGLADAITTWISVYFISSYGLQLEAAGALSSLALFVGVIVEPLGGFLLARGYKPALLIRIGTLMSFLSMLALAFPVHIFPLALLGLLLFAIGTTLPYAAIFSMAATVGKTSGAGSGIAQGIVALLASQAGFTGAPLIGFLFGHTNSFSIALGVVGLFFSGIATFASLLLVNALARTQARNPNRPSLAGQTRLYPTSSLEARKWARRPSLSPRVDPAFMQHRAYRAARRYSAH